MLNMLLASSSYLKAKYGEFMKSEKGEVNVVAIVVLIGVAVCLAIIFKDQVTNLITDLFEAISGNAGEAVTPE
ncbi:MAG: hypothetical protein BWY74_02618 [Firmicutes bacterium ADurb.Bin419]|nr:MAG: hypothetical protein BWY74_02618 [Firmicutes bacterium ADurb.Bin419]